MQHAFKGKKRTAHAKGVQPPATTKKRRSGAVEISYMAKYRDRLRTLSTRSKGLWKKVKWKKIFKTQRVLHECSCYIEFKK